MKPFKNHIPILSAFLMLIMMGSFLSACGLLPIESTTSVSTDTPTASPLPLTPATLLPTNTPATPTAEPSLINVDVAALDGVEIIFWHPWIGSMADQISQQVNDFNENNAWGIHARAISTGGSGYLFEQVRQSLATGSRPDMVVASMDMIQVWQRIGQVVSDLTPYINDPQWRMGADEIADIPPVFWEQESLDEQILAIPAVASMEVLFYNQSWAKELGFSTPPTTPDEFMEQACAAGKERYHIDETGGWLINTQPLTMLSWLYSFDYQNLPTSDEQEYLFNTPQGQQTFEYLRELYDQGCAWHARNPLPYEYFANRQALFYSGRLEDLQSQKQAFNDLGNSDEWVILPYPSLSSQPVALTSLSSYAILQSTPEKQLASWLLLRSLILPRNLAALASLESSIPAKNSAFSEMETFKNNNPQWEDTLGWLPAAYAAPGVGSWRKVRNVLEDAAWQTLQTTTNAQKIPETLIELDAIAKEVMHN